MNVYKKNNIYGSRAYVSFESLLLNELFEWRTKQEWILVTSERQRGKTRENLYGERNKLFKLNFSIRVDFACDLN